MRRRTEVSLEMAKRVGDSLYLDWNQVDLEQFRQGLMGYHRQGSDDHGLLLAGRTVLAHMQQFPDYFVRLARIRAEAKYAAAAARNVALDVVPASY